jgi:uncharacterized OsmC-like protein
MVIVKQLSGVKFSVEARHHSVVCDQPLDNGGTDQGMTPPELMLAALGSCAAYYAAQYLKTRGLADTGVEVSVSAEKLKGPARLGNFKIDVASPVELTAEQDQAMVNSVRHCLIHNTLLTPPEIEIKLHALAQAQ